MTGHNGKQGKVLAYGELLWDVLPTGPVLGGAPANFSLRLATWNVPVALVSRVGSDEFGKTALEELQNRRLDTTFVQIDPERPTGTVDVMLDEKKNAHYVINDNVAYDAIELPEELIAIAPTLSLVCFGSLIQRNEKSRATLHRLLALAPQATKLVDINLRKGCFSRETIESSLRASDILKLNIDEVAAVNELFGRRAEDLDSFCDWVLPTFDLEACLVTRAEQGVFARGRDGTRVDLPGYKVAVADTIGSGDAFTAGFVTKYLDKQPLEVCCDFGNCLGALVATTRGGMTPIAPATADEFYELHSFYKDRPPSDAVGMPR